MLISLAGCGGDPHALDWGFQFAEPALRARATVIEARILSGGCTGTVVFTTEIPVTGAMSVATARPGELAAGRYGLSGSARDSACSIIAEGCLEVQLPAAADTRQIVTLTGATERPACDPGVCSNGSCAGAGADGGPGLDSGAVDAGLAVSDAGLPPPTDAGPPPPVDAGPPPSDGGSVCAAGTADCDMNGSCETDTATDRSNCGACARRCGTAAACTAGMCTCTAPLVSDGVRGCLDPRSDPSSCGAGGTRCNDDQYCRMSSCVCRPGLESIGGGGCTDLQTDPLNCGTVGHDCSTMGSMVTCRAGTCEDACTTGQTNCSNACVDTNIDPAHCGTCTNVCNQDQVCVSGSCQDYGPALGCTMCPCATGCSGGTTCCTYGSNTICAEGSTCPTIMP